MRRLRSVRDSSAVSVAARLYGVDLFVGDVSKRVRLKVKDDWYFGPQGGAYSPTRRAVCIARDQDHQVKDDARVLHELAHLVAACPFFAHEELPEELYLLQWEAALAKYVEVDPEHYAFYAGTTRIRSARDRRLRDVRGVEERPWWRDGTDRAVRLGMVKPGAEGPELVPGAWPDWRTMSRSDRTLFLKWRASGRG